MRSVPSEDSQLYGFVDGMAHAYRLNVISLAELNRAKAWHWNNIQRQGAKARAQMLKPESQDGDRTATA